MKKTRSEIDEIAWRAVENQTLQKGVPSGYTISNRPSNYAELATMMEDRNDFELAWGEYLHEFYRYKSPSFFAVPPPLLFSPQQRAWLAGVAEYLCTRFHLHVPAWVWEPQYFLNQEWDFASETFLFAEMIMDMTPYREERRASSAVAFLKRNVIFEPRSLIVL